MVLEISGTWVNVSNDCLEEGRAWVYMNDLRYPLIVGKRRNPTEWNLHIDFGPIYVTTLPGNSWYVIDAVLYTYI